MNDEDLAMWTEFFTAAITGMAASLGAWVTVGNDGKAGPKSIVPLAADVADDAVAEYRSRAEGI